MKIKSTVDKSLAILEIEGSLSSDMKVEFDSAMGQYVEKPLHLVLDLSKVAFVDSATLGSIIKYYALFKKQGRHLVLSGINQKIYDVFRLTGVAKQVRIFDSLQGAVDFIRQNS